MAQGDRETKPRVVGAIPARWGSTRFSGKLLASLHGRPVIVRTLHAARQSKVLDDLVVAVDDERLRKVVEEEGGRVIMTEPELPSGSDRILAALKDEPADVIVNIQGDEPLLPPEVVDKTVKMLLEEDRWEVTTAAAPFKPTRRNNPNTVKVVLDNRNRALYFSRSLVPYPRDGKPSNHTCYRHIGLYVFRRETLERFCSWPPSDLEKTEKLEQLRLLSHGVPIGVAIVDPVPPGIDTREDLDKARRIFKRLERGE